MTALFILDAALVLVFALAWAAVLKPPTRPAFLIALFVLVWVDLVLVTEVLSLLVLVTAWAMLAAHALLALVAFLAWRAAGRPRPPRFLPPPFSVWTKSLKSWPDLWALGLIVVAAYGLLAVINGLVPPNNQDSMVYHLARVAFWIQHQTLAPWPTPRIHQVIFPLNVEIGSLWSMLFLRRDALAGFVQWFSALAVLVSVFGLARAFGYARARAAFASFICLTLPMIVLQSTTTQNDLTVGAMAAAMVFLLLVGLKTQHQGLLVLSGLAMGLALGMKYTAFMVLPGLGVGLGYVILTRRPRPWRRLCFWAAACLAGFMALGAFNFVQNWVRFGHPLGRASILKYNVNESNPGSWDLIRSNMARDVYSLMDFTGVPPPIVEAAAPAWQRAGRAVFSALGLPPDSQRLSARQNFFYFQTNTTMASDAGGFFGPLGFLLWLPLVAYWLVAGLIKRDARFIPAMAFAGFMAVIGAAQAWGPYRGRYYCAVIPLCAPLVAGVFGRGLGRAALRCLMLVVACTVMTLTILTNVSKPLAGPNAIWGKTRFERRAVLWDRDRIPYRILEGSIPPRATVASILTPADHEYPLFGEKLGRTVIPVYPTPDTVDLDWLQKNRYPYVVVHTTGYCRVEDLPPARFRVQTYPPFKIIIRLN